MINIIPNVRFLTTLRNSGYNNYTALADIIDNSLDTNVGTKNVRVRINGKTQKEYAYDSITVSDDGCGMTYTNLIEALKLGADTGKNKASDLGSYGTGLKAAALSIGRKFTIKTKSKDDKFYIIDFDLDVLIDTNAFAVDIREGSVGEYTFFKNQTESEIGTVIELSKLDRVTNKAMSSFRDKLIENLSLFYRLFIEQGINIYVNDNKVEGFDPMHRTESFSEMLSEDKEHFIYEDNKFEFTAFYLRKTGIEKQNSYVRNAKSVGLYIYRNNRLVGQGLKLGIIVPGDVLADGWSNGLKIELFVNGEADHLFGSTFMKMIHEKDRTELDQGFLEECKKAITCYVKEARDRNKAAEIIEKNESSQLTEEMDAIMQDINTNELMKVDSNDANEESDGESQERTGNKSDNEITESGPKSNAVSKSKINTDWELISLGENGRLFRLSRSKGKYILSINVDHVFYTNFLLDASIEVKSCIIRLYIAMGLSLDSFYYDDEETKELILDEYLLEISSNLRKLIIG
jgi:hypothetical protein